MIVLFTNVVTIRWSCHIVSPLSQAMVTGYTQHIVPSPIASRSPDDATPIIARSRDDAPPIASKSRDTTPLIISRSPDDDPSLAEHQMPPTSPRSPYLIPSTSPSPQPLFPRSRSPYHSPVTKPRASVEAPPIIRPIPLNQSAVPVPQAVVVVETERKCPSCKHIFYTLGDREFQSHVAGCFK